MNRGPFLSYFSAQPIRQKRARIERMIGRWLMGALLLIGGFQKILDPRPVMQLLADQGMPESLIVPATVFNLGAGACVLINWNLRPVCLSSCAYCAFTSLFHFIPADGWQMSIFVKNWAIAGGFLCLAATTDQLQSTELDR
ncbi:DoxX family protein [Rhodobacteraceae bacterium]|nr:DoxX family protein [Paracoccaceae bacterium]